MSTDPEEHDDDLEVGDEHGTASLTDLKVAHQRSQLSAQPSQKAGDITEQLARIKLPGETDLSADAPPPAAPVAAPNQPPLRAVRDIEPDQTAAPAPPSDHMRPTEQLQAATQAVAASREASDMAYEETQQELLSMMDRISAGLSDDEAAAPPPPPPPPAQPAPELRASEPAAPPTPPAPPAPPPPAAPAPLAQQPQPQPQPQPEPPPAAPAAAAPQPPAAAPAAAEAPKQDPFSRMPQGLVKYWMSLTNGRKYPSWENFEQAKIADYWPNSMVLTCGPPDGRGDVTISKVTRIADQNVTPSTSGANRVEYTPMLTEWILSLGKATAGAGKPMQEADRFPTNEGIVRYQIILLPLSDEQTSIDHVLCHVYRG